MSRPNDPARATHITLARHGETTWAIDGRHTGRTDIPLTDNGRLQAERIGERLADGNERFALVLASPLSRAFETCRLAGLGEQAVVTDDLAEWDYGTYEGRRTADIRQERPGWALWRDGVPRGESAVDVGRRVDRVIAQARATPGDVALFAHGHVLRVLAVRWLGLPPENGAHLALDTAAIGRLGWEREVPVISSWNDIAHLETTSD